jgi:hypothetical protein
LVWTEQTKNVYILSNVPIGVPVDQLIQLSELIPNKLVEELLEHGHIALTPTSYARQFKDEELSVEAIKKILQRNGASDLGSLVAGLPSLYQTACEVAEYRAGDKRKDIHRHLFLPKSFSHRNRFAVSSAYNPKEVQEILDQLWIADGGTTELKVYPYTPKRTNSELV